MSNITFNSISYLNFYIPNCIRIAAKRLRHEGYKECAEAMIKTYAQMQFPNMVIANAYCRNDYDDDKNGHLEGHYTFNIPDFIVTAIKNFERSSQKVAAIKLLRDFLTYDTDVTPGLKESKEFVEEIWRET